MGSSITPTPAPRPRREGRFPPGLALDQAAEALGEVGDSAADGAMWVRPEIPSSGLVFEVRTYLLAIIGIAPALDLYPQRVPVKEALELYQGIA